MLRRSPTSARRRWLLQSIIGLITLPLSAVPIWLYGTHTAVGELLTMRMRYEFMAPSTPRLDAASTAAARADRARTYVGIPVLFYSIGRPTESFDGRYMVNRTHFAEQMEALRAAGYSPIRVEQLAQYVRTGSRAGLPRKPVLITFDDATTETMMQADPILAATGMRAVMFVTTSRAASGSLFSEGWGSLSGYAGNGRWELENRTGMLSQVVGHGRKVETKLVSAQPDESMSTYGARVASDLESAESQIDDHGAGHAVAFAYPYGNWGQHARPGIVGELRHVVGQRFSVAFDQDGQSGWRPALPGDDRLHVHRLEVMDWTGAELIHRLQAGAALGRAVYAERGLDHNYSALQIVRAAKAYRCAGTPGTVLPDQVSVPHTVALSFNDGPSAYTPQILHLLEHAHVHATFFVARSELAGRTRILMRMLADHDEIGLGATVASGQASATTEAQLDDAVRAIQTAVPLSPCLVRPAQRSQTAALVHVAARLGERVVLWSVDPRDFSTTDPALIASRVLREARPGSIITLHDGGSDRWATVQALPAILAGLAKRHIAVTTVTALYHTALSPSAARPHHH
jgi:peptidoglycan/xylan/chitin deacetylase (PgdA/CDA1 family)